MNSLYLVCLLAFTVAIAHHHTQLVFSEYPLDYNEGGMLVTTDTISQGGNPFSLENQPARISVYPVLFSVIVAPFSRVFGNTLELHRMLVGLFILASCALCYHLCRSNSGNRTESFTAAALCYAAFLYYSTPIAGPNGLGLFFFLLAITIPWMYEFSTRSLIVAIVLGILAFHTKQYFIASLGYIALYLFLAVSKLRAIYFGLAALAVFIIVLVFVSYTSPYYLENTFFAVRSSALLASSDAFLVSQSKEFLQHYLPVLVILVLAMLYRWRSKAVVGVPLEQNSQSEGFVNLFNLDKPLLQRKPNYVWVCCACSVIIVALSLGKNQGNHLTYFLQLISPFLLVGTFALSSNIPNWRWPFRILALWAMYNSYSILQTDFSVNEDSWRIVKKEIAEANDIYASTLVLQEIMEKGLPVYESGATRYFIFGANALPYLKKSDPEHELPEIWERYVQLTQGKIKNREFDLLLIDNWMPLPESLRDTEIDAETFRLESLLIDDGTKKLLLQNYRSTRVVLSLPQRPGGGDYSVQIWKPIPAKPGEGKQHAK